MHPKVLSVQISCLWIPNLHGQLGGNLFRSSNLILS